MLQAKRRVKLDAPRGFEPRLTESESVVLPLDDGATLLERGGEIESASETVNMSGSGLLGQSRVPLMVKGLRALRKLD